MFGLLRRIKRAYNSIISTGLALEQMEHISTTNLTPIEKYLYHVTRLRSDALFDRSYDTWRMTRINKMLMLYGVDYFAGKKILELGAGHCEIGAFFADLGAEVTCLEGRQENIAIAKLKHRKVPRLRIEQADLEKDFTNYGRFDLILHYGLLYHLPNIEQHMKWVFSMSDDILVETVVMDSSDPNEIVIVPGRREVQEEALGGKGCRPSPFYVERIAKENGFKVVRHFSRDLNVGDQFVYDWPHKNDGDLGGWRNRRFWQFSRSSAAASHVQNGIVRQPGPISTERVGRASG